MIRLVEALRYRSLRDIRQPVRPFQVLVGPNASGKSTFLDVIGFLGDLLRDGLSAAAVRSPDFRKLLWMEQAPSRIELAVELQIPEERLKRLPANGYHQARYEVAVGTSKDDEISILGETLWLKPANRPTREVQPSLFPSARPPRDTFFRPAGSKSPSGWRKVVSKKPESGNDYFLSETTNWNNPFRFGPQKLALANLFEEEDRFPVATWVKRFLIEGMQLLVLNSEKMRLPSPPGSPMDFQPDGSNLPRVIAELNRTAPKRFERWIEHVRTALPDVETVETVERPEDRHRYLQVLYRTGLRAPSWTVSDGTLRLLALTLIAYLEDPDRIYLIEEPENGIHPQAVEAVYQSLSSAYGSQILCATHSPVFLSLAEPEQLLCFARTRDGVTDIVTGSEHPNLREWRRGTDLGTLFATGILG